MGELAVQERERADLPEEQRTFAAFCVRLPELGDGVALQVRPGVETHNRLAAPSHNVLRTQPCESDFKSFGLQLSDMRSQLVRRASATVQTRIAVVDHAHSTSFYVCLPACLSAHAA